MTKCAHEVCQNKAVVGVYCRECVHEPRHECSFCNYLGLPELEEDPVIIDKKAEKATIRRNFLHNWLQYGLFILLIMWIIIMIYLVGWWWD